jgi:hypothetical protein
MYFSSSCFRMNGICMFKWMVHRGNGGTSLWAGYRNTRVFITELFHLIRRLFAHEMLKCDSSTLTHSKPVNIYCFTAQYWVVNVSVTYILNLYLVKIFICWIGRFRTAFSSVKTRYISSLTVHGFIILVMLGEHENDEGPHCVILSSLLWIPPRSKNCPQHPLLNHPQSNFKPIQNYR